MVGDVNATGLQVMDEPGPWETKRNLLLAWWGIIPNPLHPSPEAIGNAQQSLTQGAGLCPSWEDSLFFPIPALHRTHWKSPSLSGWRPEKGHSKDTHLMECREDTTVVHGLSASKTSGT
jgi:hypothetical protein